MDTIEAQLAEWIERFDRYEAIAARAYDDSVGRRCATAWMLIASQATVIASRCVSLTEGFMVLVNENNAHSAPPVVRALFETCCVAFYLRHNVSPRLRAERTEQVQKILWRLGMGTTPDAGVGHIKPVRVKKLLEAGRQWLAAWTTEHYPGQSPPDVFTMVYGPLSDRTHPNYGATTASQRIDTAGGIVEYTMRPGFDHDSIDQLLSGCSYGLMSAAQALDPVVADAEAHPMEFEPGQPNWTDDELHGEPPDEENSGLG